MNNQSQSPLSQFSKSQIRQLHRAPTVEEKAELIARFKAQNLAASKLPKLDKEPLQDEKYRELVERSRRFEESINTLGLNPTAEEIFKLAVYGFERHRLNFPHLYKDEEPGESTQVDY